MFMLVSELPGKYDAIQWDGESSTADTIAAMFDNGSGPFPWRIESTTEELLLLNSFSNELPVPIDGWVVAGPYWGTAPAGLNPIMYTNAEFQQRFQAVE
jgi:hypothetical protein